MNETHLKVGQYPEAEKQTESEMLSVIVLLLVSVGLSELMSSDRIIREHHFVQLLPNNSKSETDTLNSSSSIVFVELHCCYEVYTKTKVSQTRMLTVLSHFYYTGPVLACGCASIVTSIVDIHTVNTACGCLAFCSTFNHSLEVGCPQMTCFDFIDKLEELRRGRF